MSRYTNYEDSSEIQQRTRERRLAKEREEHDSEDRIIFLTHWEDYCNQVEEHYTPDDQEDIDGFQVRGGY